MDEGRRRFLVGAAALAAAAWTRADEIGSDGAPSPDPIPPLPSKPTPGRPGDFGFLTGEWRIRHHQRKEEGQPWVAFAGEATVHGILAGVGSVEELRIPDRKFSGLGLRLLDVEKKTWVDHWVDARSGVLTTPGVSGSFENGAGIFVSDDDEDGKPVKWIGVWDLVTPRSCRWRQAVSRDGGRTWRQTWIMAWRRV